MPELWSRTSALAILVLVSSLLGFSSRASATASISGPTGLLMIPTALTLRQYEFDLAVDLWRVTDPAGNFTFTSMRGTVGVLPERDSGAELGFLKPDAKALGLTDAYVHGKYRIPGILPGGALAVGGVFSTNKSNYSSIYLVGSSAIAKSFALHYGGGVNVYGDPYGWSWYGGRRSSGRADPAFAMFGAEFDYRRFRFCADYNGGFISYGINFFPDSFFSLSAFKLGRGDFERELGISHGFGVGATVRF